jgi:hypothetical protein
MRTQKDLEKSGTFEINSGHLYKKGDCPGKHGANEIGSIMIIQNNYFQTTQTIFVTCDRDAETMKSCG